nr:MAG TPA: hypothetical protein [Caudoviricetes sp.]
MQNGFVVYHSANIEISLYIEMIMQRKICE